MEWLQTCQEDDASAYYPPLTVMKMVRETISIPKIAV